MAQSQSWSSRNTSRNSIRSSEEEALRARAEQEKQLRDLDRREKIEGLKDYKDKFKQINKYLAEDLKDNLGSVIIDVAGQFGQKKFQNLIGATLKLNNASSLKEKLMMLLKP